MPISGEFCLDPFECLLVWITLISLDDIDASLFIFTREKESQGDTGITAAPAQEMLPIQQEEAPQTPPKESRHHSPSTVITGTSSPSHCTNSTSFSSSSFDKLSVSSSWCSQASGVRSLDDEDLPSYSFIKSRSLRHDLDAVKWCTIFMQGMENVWKLEDGRYSEDIPGADVFNVVRDNQRGTIQVSRVTEKMTNLIQATEAGRQTIAGEIAKREHDMAELEKEISKLVTTISDSDGESVEELGHQMAQLSLMIGKHKKRIKELMQMDTVEVKVNVARIYTRVEVGREDNTSESTEVKTVSTREPCIYALGGASDADDLKSALSSVERLHAKTGEWQTVTSMTSKRVGCSVALYDGALFAIGGHDGTCELSSVEKMDLRSNKWEEVACLPNGGRTGCAAAVVKGQLLVAGGHGYGGDDLSCVSRYDAATNSWTAMAPMTCRRAYAAAAAMGGWFYVVGGLFGGTRWSTVERFDPDTNTWELIPPMTCKRVGCSAAVLNQHLYVLGGEDGETDLNTVERFDPIRKKWEVVAPLNTRRDGCAACVVGGHLYAIGGFRRDTGSTFDTVERYDEVANKWTMVASMKTTRFTLAAVAV
eukprot:g3208.t1